MFPSELLPTAPSSAITADLRRLCRSEGSVRTGVMLRDFSSWRIGGPADWLVTPSSVDEVISLVCYLAQRAIPWVVIGHTTNLLFADEGFRGVLLQFGNRMARMSIVGGRVAAEAGIWVPRFWCST